MLKLVDNKSDAYTYKFIGAEATNTRLMGVIGLVVKWSVYREDKFIKNINQIFHLDFEEYGIDGYHVIDDEDKSYYIKTLMSVTGGLGGEFMELNYGEMNVLLYDCFRICKEAAYDYKDMIEEFGHLLFKCDETFRQSAMEKVSIKVEGEYELINYFMMRLAGFDDMGMEFLSDGISGLRISAEPSTLIKNVISSPCETSFGKVYKSTSLIDNSNGYRFVTSEVTINSDMKVSDIRILSKVKASTTEAAFALRKKEHICVCYVDNLDFEEEFENFKPYTMCNYHMRGTLYTEFNKNNNHVKEQIYFLSSDIYAIYYYTDESQLVITSFVEENLDEVLIKLKERFGDGICDNSKFVADLPIIYDFVNSNSGDFYDFL